MKRERAMLGNKREREDEAVKTASSKKKKDEAVKTASKKKKKKDEAVKTASKKKKKKKKDESSHHNVQQCDNPSDFELHLVHLALQKCHQDIMQVNQKRPDICPWMELAFGGGLLINSYVDDGIWCHANFKVKVRVIDTSRSSMWKDGPLLLFAELKPYHGKADYEVISCHLMGPSKFLRKPRLHGCNACNRAPFREFLIHPNPGRKFNVGPPLVHVPKIPVADAVTTEEDQVSHD